MVGLERVVEEVVDRLLVERGLPRGAPAGAASVTDAPVGGEEAGSALPDRAAGGGEPSAIPEAPAEVSLIPLCADSQGLAVVDKSLGGIRVEELGGGTGTYDFDVLVLAVRSGHEGFQVVRPKGGSPGPADR